MRLKFILFLSSFCLSATVLWAQENDYHKGDTTIVAQGYRMEIKRLSIPVSRAVWYYDSLEPQHNVKYIASLDSAARMMPKGVQIPFMSDSIAHNQEVYQSLDYIVCANGMKLIFKNYFDFQRYYPREKIIKFNLGYPFSGAFDIMTGEDAIDPIYLRYANSQNYRVHLVQDDDYNEVKAAMVQVRKQGSRDYVDLIDLTTLFDADENINSVFWIDETLFFDNNRASWFMTFPEMTND